jgi:hypothetical protein
MSDSARTSTATTLAIRLDPHENERTTPSRSTRRGRFRRLDGLLGRRARDRHAPYPGRPRPTVLIRAVIAYGAVLLLAGTAVWLLRTYGPLLPTGTFADLTATITRPVDSYLDDRTTHLAIDASTAYTTWQWTGAIALVTAARGSIAGRLTWSAWSCASVAMVWTGTPAPDREVAAGIAVLAWTATSGIAFRRPSSRPTVVRSRVKAFVPAPRWPSRATGTTTFDAEVVPRFRRRD